MQMRKGKSPRSAFRSTINPEDMFPTGSPGSSCCGLRNSRAQGLQTELFPTHSEQSLLLIRLLGGKKQPSHPLQTLTITNTICAPASHVFPAEEAHPGSCL